MSFGVAQGNLMASKASFVLLKQLTLSTTTYLAIIKRSSDGWSGPDSGRDKNNLSSPVRGVSSKVESSSAKTTANTAIALMYSIFLQLLHNQVT